MEEELQGLWGRYIPEIAQSNSQKSTEFENAGYDGIHGF